MAVGDHGDSGPGTDAGERGAVELQGVGAGGQLGDLAEWGDRAEQLAMGTVQVAVRRCAQFQIAAAFDLDGKRHSRGAEEGPVARGGISGETKRLRGWLSFYEGSDIEGELRRIERTGWQKGQGT